LGVLRLFGFPEIHTRARYFKALVLIEDPLYVLERAMCTIPVPRAWPLILRT
jgi:hypothetical protein